MEDALGREINEDNVSRISTVADTDQEVHPSRKVQMPGLTYKINDRQMGMMLSGSDPFSFTNDKQERQAWESWCESEAELRKCSVGDIQKRLAYAMYISNNGGLVGCDLSMCYRVADVYAQRSNPQKPFSGYLEALDDLRNTWGSEPSFFQRAGKAISAGFDKAGLVALDTVYGVANLALTAIEEYAKAEAERISPDSTKNYETPVAMQAFREATADIHRRGKEQIEEKMSETNVSEDYWMHPLSKKGLQDLGLVLLSEAPAQGMRILESMIMGPAASAIATGVETGYDKAVMLSAPEYDGMERGDKALNVFLTGLVNSGSQWMLAETVGGKFFGTMKFANPTREAIKSVFKSMGSEATQEAMEQLAENAADLYTGVHGDWRVMSWQEKQKILLDGVPESAIVGGVFGATMEGPIGAMHVYESQRKANGVIAYSGKVSDFYGNMQNLSANESAALAQARRIQEGVRNADFNLEAERLLDAEANCRDDFRKAVDVATERAYDEVSFMDPDADYGQIRKQQEENVMADLLSRSVLTDEGMQAKADFDAHRALSSMKSTANIAHDPQETSARVEKVMAEIGRDMSATIATGVTWESLPREVRDKVYQWGGNAGDIPRFMPLADGTLWINADKVNPADVENIVLQYGAMEKGLRRIIGDDKYAETMLRIYEGMKNTAMMEQFVDGDPESLTDHQKMLAAARMTAQMAQDFGIDKLPGFARKCAQAIRQAFTGTPLKENTLSENDLLTLVARSLDALAGGKGNVVETEFGGTKAAWDAIDAIANRTGVKWRRPTETEYADEIRRNAESRGLSEKEFVGRYTVNGWFKGDTGEVIVAPGTSPLFAAGHEFLHHLKLVDPAGYDALIRDLSASIGKEEAAELEKVRKIYDGTSTDAEEEYWCNRFGELLQDPEKLRRFSLEMEMKNAGMARRILIRIREYIRSILDAMGGKDTLQERRLRRADEMVGKILDNLERNGGAETTAGEGTAKYSVTPEQDANAMECSRKFNEELLQHINGNISSNHIYDIGMPGGILQGAGIPELPIELTKTRLDEKSNSPKHPFDIQNLKDLPSAIQRPVAVFSYLDPKKMNIIVELQNDGKNFLVGLQLNSNFRGMTINNIRGLFPKDTHEWLNWIQQGKARYLDKQKIQTIIEQQRTNPADVPYLDLDSLHKIVNEFKNANEILENNKESVKFSVVEDEQKIAELDASPKVIRYRAMQLIDGRLYPPMAAKVNGKLVQSAKIGDWVETDIPDMPAIEEMLSSGQMRRGIGGKLEFKLNKGNGKSILASYNPYLHTSNTPLNDQFSSAYDRPNLVVVEVEVPASELTSGFHAEGAKDSVGDMKWHSGPIASKLAKIEGEWPRIVTLTRWCKIVRVVPDSEVASMVSPALIRNGIEVPGNVVTPSLATELEKQGVVVTHDNDIRYSVTDSDNFRNWFGDSKVVDENGEPLVVYRGEKRDLLSEEPGKAVTKPVSYFTGNPEYARRYGKVNAYYLRMEHPLDVRNPDDARRLSEFYPDGYSFATGKTGALDWAEMANFDIDELREKYPEYDGIILDEGGDPSDDGGVAYRGVSYVPFDGGAQVKSATHNNGNYSEDPDIRYSVTEDSPVRRKDLLAAHNLSESALRKAIQLGGFPMPSIAVFKDTMGHSHYGGISLLFAPSTIDPKAGRNNIYSGDAWSPTFPTIYNDIDWKKAEAIGREIKKTVSDAGLSGIDGFYELDSRPAGLESYLKYGDPAERLSGNIALKAAYLLENGESIERRTKVENYAKYANTAVSFWMTNDDLEAFGREFGNLFLDGDGNRSYDRQPSADDLERMREWLKNGYANSRRMRLMEKHDAKFARDKLDAYLSEGMSLQYADSLAAAYVRMKNSSADGELDTYAIRDDVERRVASDDSAYLKWLEGKYDGIVIGEGIRNGKDPYTSSGYLRSFSATHDPVTLVNVVRSMLKTQPEHGGVFGANPYGAATEKYRNLDAVVADESRLAEADETELKEVKAEALDDINYVAEVIHERKGNISDLYSMHVVDDLLDAYVKGNGVPARVRSEMNKGGFYNATEGEISAFMNAMKKLRNLPTRYFEAKPQRAVYFDEVKAAVVPDGASDDIVAYLRKNGIPVYTYAAEDEQSRMETVSEAADDTGIKFSVTEEANSEPASEPSDPDAISAFYAPDQVTQIAQFLKPVVMNYGADAKEMAGKWLEMNGVKISRPQDVDYFMGLSASLVEADQAEAAKLRLQATADGGPMTKAQKKEVMKIVYPMWKSNRTIGEKAVVDELAKAGISVTEKQAQEFIHDATMKWASTYKEPHKATKEWLSRTNQYFDFLANEWFAKGTPIMVNPGRAHIGENFSGSFIDPAFVRYSNRKFKGLTPDQVKKRLQDSIEKAGNIHQIDVIAQAYAESRGIPQGEESRIEQEILDFLNGKTWASFEEMRMAEMASAAEGERALTEQYYGEWLDEILPEAMEFVGEGQQFTRDMVDKDRGFATVVYEIMSGKPHDAFSETKFPDYDDAHLEGLNAAIRISGPMPGMLDAYVDTYAEAKNRMPASATMEDIHDEAINAMLQDAPDASKYQDARKDMEARLAKRDETIREMKSKMDAIKKQAKQTLDAKKMEFFSARAELVRQLEEAKRDGFSPEDRNAIAEAAKEVLAGMDERKAKALLGKIMDISKMRKEGTKAHPEGERAYWISQLMDEIGREKARQYRDAIRRKMLSDTERWRSRLSRKGIPMSQLSSDAQPKVDRIADILRMGEEAAQASIMVGSRALAEAEDAQMQSVKAFGRTMSLDELRQDLHLLQTFGLSNATVDGMEAAAKELSQILETGRSEWEAKHAEVMARAMKDQADIKKALNGTANVSSSPADRKDSTEWEKWKFKNMQAETLLYLAAGRQAVDFQNSSIGRIWEDVQKADDRLDARNMRDDRRFSEAVSSVIGSTRAIDAGRFFKNVEEVRDTGIDKTVYSREMNWDVKGFEYSMKGERAHRTVKFPIEVARAALADFDAAGGETAVSFRHGDMEYFLDPMNAEFVRRQISDHDAKLEADYDLSSDPEENEAINNAMNEARKKGEIAIIMPPKKEGQARKERLFMSKAQALQAILTWDQADARAIMRWNGWNQEIIDGLKRFCGKDVLKLGQWMRQTLEDGRAELDDAVYARYGAHMPDVRNYFPTRYSSAGRAGNTAYFSAGQPKSMDRGFLVKRRFHTRDIDTNADAFAVFKDAMKAQARFIEMAEPMAYARRVLFSRDVKLAMEGKYGPAFLSQLQDRMAVIEGGDRAFNADGFIGRLYQAFVPRQLAFNVASAMKQSLSGIAYLNKCTARQYVGAMLDVSRWTPEYRKFLEIALNSDYLKDRAKSGWSADVRLAMAHADRANVGMSRVGQMLNKAGFYGMAMGDRFSAITSGYAIYKAAYEGSRANGRSETDARDAAFTAWKRATDETQQSGRLKDQNFYQSGGAGDAGRMLTMFLSNPIQILNTEYRQFVVAAEEYKRGNKGKAARIALKQAAINHLIVPTLMMMVTDLFRHGITGFWDEMDFEDYFVAWLVGPFEGATLAGEAMTSVATSLLRMLEGKDGKRSGGAGDPTDFGNAFAVNLGELADGDISEKDATALADIFTAAGTVVGLANPALGDAIVDIAAPAGALTKQVPRTVKAFSTEEDGKRRKK